MDAYVGPITQTYRMDSAFLPTDFTELLFNTIPHDIFKEIEYALRIFMRERGAIFQHTVIIKVDDRWTGCFIIDDNMNPTTLVLTLQ